MAQDPRSTGATYIVAFPDTTTNTFDARYPNRMEDKIYIYMYSAVNNNKIAVTGNGFNRVLTGQAGKFTILELTDPTFKAPTPVVTESGKPTKNGTFRIEAQQPIVVYCYMVTKFGCAAFTPIPVEFWGTEHYAQGLPGEPANDVAPAGEFNYYAKRKMAPSEIVVIAAEDNTLITFVPSANSRLLDNPQINAVRLNKDEAYQIQSWVDTSEQADANAQPDLSGVYITSTKPVGVLSGMSRAMVFNDVAGLAKNSFKDMMIEWVAPVEQHGRQFVYMPTMDARRPKGTPGEDLTEKRSGELVRIYATNTQRKKTTGYETDPGTGTRTFFTIERPSEFYHDRIGVPEARYFKTDSIAQAFMHTTAVVKFLGTTGYGGGYIGAKYDGWGTYSVEMVPREQWINAAPYFAPIHPSNMEHFLNVVTDTASAKKLYWGNAGSPPTNPVLLNKPIKGTDLVWGSITVNTGLDLFMTGWDTKAGKPDTSVKFYAFVYGLYKGHEEYRPGKTGKKDEGGSGIASAGTGKKDEVLHPSEYEEYLAVTYGYPLAPSRIILRPSDSLQIDTTMECFKLTVNIKALNENPVGLRSIALDSVNNAKINYVDPISPSEIIGKTKATFDVVPINPLRNASAVIIITDRTNKTWRIKYSYEAEYVNVVPDNPAVLDFGEVTLNSPATKKITVTNPLKKDVQIKSLSFALGNQEFKIIKPTAAQLPITLKPNETMEIEVEITPTIENKLYEDSVKIKLSCTDIAVKVQAETVSPCLYIDDYNFGTLAPGQDSTQTVSICNLGRGYISFKNPAGADVITWLETNFSITQADKDKLKNTILGPGKGPADPNVPSCVQINLTFKSSVTGVFQTTARLWASTRDCRDTSIWTATVTQPGPQITGYDWHDQWVTTLNNCTKNTLGQYEALIYVSNNGSSPFKVQSLDITGADAAYFKFDKSDPTTTVQPIPGLEIKEGDANKRAQKVLFTPDAERNYLARVQLVTDKNDTVQALLQGTGIESHISIAGNNYGRVEFKGAGATTVTGKAVLSTKPTRVTTITDLRISGADAANFRFNWNAATAPYNYLPTVANPWRNIPINTDINIPIDFVPSAPGDKVALIEAFGDFAKCDISLDTLIGTTYTLTADVTNVPFPTTLTCFTADSAAFLTNTGSDPIIIRQITVANPSGAFAFSSADLAVPITLAGGKSHRVGVTFQPAAAGPFAASLIFEVYNSDGSLKIGDYKSDITGTGKTVTTTADILDDYSVFPGADLKIPVELKVDPDQMDAAQIDKLSFNITYESGMMRLRNGAEANLTSMLAGTVLEGWTPTVTTLADGQFAVDFVAPAGKYLQGSGVFLNLVFQTFVGSAKASDLKFDITVTDRSCATITTSPGHAKLQEICGLDFRLIAPLSGIKYSLEQNSPNPFNPSTNIIFSVGLDGQTTVSVYNANGEKVAVLVDQYLNPGTYTVTWDATAFPSGLYYYRINSGVWSKTETMMLQK
jgi:hypothetical protein